MPTNSTLTATIALSSTTLFPNPAAVNVSSVQSVSGSAEFAAVQIPANTTSTIYGPSAGAAGSHNTLYFYAGAPTTNPASMSISITGSSASGSIAVLKPGDFIYMPVNVNAANLSLIATNTSATTSSILNVFWGVR